jgi:type I restriction enzyme S subunit
MVVNVDQNKEVNKDFLYYMLMSQDLSTCITGTGQPQIIRAALSNFELPIPSGVAEQTAIAEVLSDMDAEITALERRLAKTRALKQGMMQELLTGKTRLV